MARGARSAVKMSLPLLAKLDRAALRAVSEKDFQAAVLDYAKARGWRCHWMRRNAMVNKAGKWHALGTAGWPDVVAVRNGVVVALELKSETGTATQEQKDWIVELAQIGCNECGRAGTMIARPEDAALIMEWLK